MLNLDTYQLFLIYSQPVGRGFRGSRESSSTQPLTLFLREFSLPWEILLSLFCSWVFNVFFFSSNKVPQKKASNTDLTSQ